MRENYIFRVKKPSDSKSTWDLYAPVSTISRNESFPPDKACPLMQRTIRAPGRRRDDSVLSIELASSMDVRHGPLRRVDQRRSKR